MEFTKRVEVPVTIEEINKWLSVEKTIDLKSIFKALVDGVSFTTDFVLAMLMNKIKLTYDIVRGNKGYDDMEISLVGTSLYVIY